MANDARHMAERDRQRGGALRLGSFELRRFRGPLPVIALIFVALVPLLYGAIYLSANWDPYGNLDRLPVAVVNEDRPVDYNGETIAAGRDFTDGLVEDNNFGWHVVDRAEAQRGLREGDYYLTVFVPADFSESLISGAGDDPRRANIFLERNDANGFVIGSITGKAEDSITQAVDQAAIENYFKAVFANLTKIRSGMSDANDGAGQLADGLGTAADGSRQLADGAGQAADAGGKLADGAAALHTGTGELADGSARLAEGSGKLRAGSGRLASGTRELAGGLGKAADGADQLADGSRQVADGTQQLNDRVLPPLDALRTVLPELRSDAQTISGDAVEVSGRLAGRTDSLATDLAGMDADLKALAEKNPELGEDPAYRRLSDRVDSASERASGIAERADRIATGAKSVDGRIRASDGLEDNLGAARNNLVRLNDGAQQVAAGNARLAGSLRDAGSGADRLAAGAGELNDGVIALDDGASSLAAGARRLDDGAAQLDSGAGELAGGLRTLRNSSGRLSAGIAQLDDGAQRLHDGLSRGLERLPVISEAQAEEAAQVLSAPADVQMTVDNPADYYGRGLAPMFFSIALWVFGISAFLVMRPIATRTLAGRANPVRLALGGWLPVGAVAVVGGLAMIGIVWATMGLAPAHPLAFVGLTLLGAVTFSLLASALRLALGTPGSALLLITLIVQLAAAGGTYPPEILPAFFRALHPLLPMTYLIDAYRIAISGGQLDRLWLCVGVLAGWALAAGALAIWTVARRRRFGPRDLAPPIPAP